MTDFIKACIRANEEIAHALKEGFDASWFEKNRSRCRWRYKLEA